MTGALLHCCETSPFSFKLMLSYFDIKIQLTEINAWFSTRSKNWMSCSLRLTLGPLFFNILAADTFYQCDDWHYADKTKTYVDKTKSCTSKILTKLIVRDTSSILSKKENLLENLRVTDLRLFHATVLFLQPLETSENLRFLEGIERDEYLKWFNLDVHVFFAKKWGKRRILQFCMCTVSICTGWKVYVFGLSLVGIQSACGKIRTRNTLNTDNFDAVMVMKFFIALHFSHLSPDRDASFQIPKLWRFLILTRSCLFLNS